MRKEPLVSVEAFFAKKERRRNIIAPSANIINGHTHKKVQNGRTKILF